jgi:hypothetical protein
MLNNEFTTGQVRPVEIFREAWELIRERFWPLLGFTILGLLIGSVVPVVLIGPMMCGIFLIMFRVIDRQKIGFDDLFKGFDYIWKSLPVSLLIMVPMFILILVVYIPMIAMALAAPKMDQTELFAFLGGWVIFEFLVVLLMVCFHTLLIFAFPLVADRGLSGLAAAKLSIRAVRANLKGVAGLMGLSAIAVLVGYVILCIGVYLALPIIFMSQAIAYRRIFPHIESRAILDPPAPSVYTDLS